MNADNISNENLFFEVIWHTHPVNNASQQTQTTNRTMSAHTVTQSTGITTNKWHQQTMQMYAAWRVIKTGIPTTQIGRT